MANLIDKKKAGINYDSYTANLPIDGIRIADYPPPPILISSNTVVIHFCTHQVRCT
jgi:hypothetical protein